MELFPHAKVNLSLYITGRRPDGYHTVDTVYWPLPLFDYLKVEPSDRNRFATTEKELEGKDNLVIRAWELLHEQYRIPPVAVRLEKGIPWQAGLGGGSGDAAAMLQACSRLFSLGLTRKKLCEIGKALGADVPALLWDAPARGRGTGTDLEGFDAALFLPLLVVKPPQGFSTAAMYRAWDEGGGRELPAEAIEKRQQGLIRALSGEAPEAVIPFLHNDFETVLAGEDRALFEQARSLLAESGALKSLLCGSGSAVFGLYASEEARQTARESLREALPEAWGLHVPFRTEQREVK
ncbi:MAG: 4-(cytidine 5'-diphospho)-2-C-methyl-D-erythritol kinase [Lachnospiraceae bacterium]|nr:4-(cytidine 5'-diphospho)-2-C-methyl-D-erythritol kinase [Lachnospiraceae bacterium]